MALKLHQQYAAVFRNAGTTPKEAARRLKKMRHSRTAITRTTATLRHTNQIMTILQAHSPELPPTPTLRKIVHTCGPRLQDTLTLLQTTPNPHQASTVRDLTTAIRQLLEHEPDVTSLPVNGNTITELLNIEPGPIIGQILSELTHIRLQHGPITRTEAETFIQNYPT